MKHFKLFLLLIFVYFQSFAQENSFYHYGLNEGISQGSIRVILKDAEGFIWLGTQDGLNRFDGNSFKVYKNYPDDPQSITGDYINDLLDDIDRIWIATASNGLCYYDKKRDKFVSIGYQNANCTDLKKDKFGNIYALYLSKGLSVFSVRNNKVQENTSRFKNTKNIHFSAIFINDHQDIYLGSKEGNLYYANLATTNDVLRVSYSPASVKAINSITELDHKLWLGTDSGLYNCQTQTKILKKISFGSSYADTKDNMVIYDLISIGNSYFIATDNGLIIAQSYNDQLNKFELVRYFKGDKNKPNSITSNRVYDLLDDENLLWIGTNKLDVLSLEDPVFKTINTTSKININNDFVFSIFKTQDYTFIGTRNGLNCIDNNGNQNVITKENTNNSLTYNVIRGINKDANNNLWLATTKGVSVIDLDDFDPKQPKIKSLYFDVSNPSSLSHNNTRSIFIDHKNQIWIATYGGGIDRFTGNLKTNDFSFVRYTTKQLNHPISSDLTYSISQDSDSNYWIATKNGLNKLFFNGSNKPIFTVLGKENKKFANKSILTTYQDYKNNLIWIGSHTGLYRYNRSTQEIKSYTEKDGLTNDVIYSILEDSDEKLWLSTNLGLFSFDKNTETFANFGVKDGLQSSEFNLGALFNDHNTLYFGGVNGVNYFNPKDIDRLYSEGNLVFTSLRIKDKDISPSNTTNTLAGNIVNANKIILKHDDFPTYLSFSDLNYSQINSSEFVYRLLPNDKKWNKLNNRKEIQLLNLPAGNYKIQVQGKNKGKIWKKAPLEISLSVSSAWYNSKFAYILYIFLVVGLIFFYYNMQMQKKIDKRELYRLQEVSKKNEIINKALAEKEVLFKEIHHRVKNNLQIVASILSLQERYLTNPKAVEAIKDSQNRINSISLIHQQLYAKDTISAIKMKDYIDDLAYSIIDSSETDSREINYQSNIDDLLLEIDTATPIGLILNELITNSIKHNNDISLLNLHISLLKKGQSLDLTVQDNGKGVPRNFDFSNNMTYGMKLIESLLRKLKAKITFTNNNGLIVNINIQKYKEIENKV